MIDDVIILDDVIPQGYQDAIEELIFKKNYPWWYQADSSYGDAPNGKPKYPSFNHSLLQDGNILNSEFSFFQPIAWFACERINFKIQNFLYVKSCLQVPLIMEDDRSNNPHVDYTGKHLVCLYYVNDSDGDTLIYNKLGDFDGDKTQLEIKYRISPKKGRVVLFNGSLLHNSTTPKNGPRCIINFDVA